ncbi:MAG: hypothetical protein QXS54_00750 [Candidatus Methanomethylicaceae archaeon]
MTTTKRQTPQWVKRRVSRSKTISIGKLIRTFLTGSGVLVLVIAFVYGLYLYTAHVDSHDLMLQQQIKLVQVPTPNLDVQLDRNGDLVIEASHERQLYVSIYLDDVLLKRETSVKQGGGREADKHVLRLSETLPSDRLGIHTLKVVVEPHDRPDRRVVRVLTYLLSRSGVELIAVEENREDVSSELRR